MQSFLIIGNNVKHQTELEQLIKRFSIAPIDIYSVSKAIGLFERKQKSIGVEDIRNILPSISIGPAGGKKKIIVFEQFETATVEAQNAMLKVLEEPPQHTIIVLLVLNKENILSTILSRCFLIETTAGASQVLDEQKEILFTFFSNIDVMPLHTKLELAEKLAKNKDEAIIWVTNAIQVGREILLESLENSERLNKTRGLLSELINTHKILSTTNANVRLTLEHLLLSL
jgi:hypothetical protein